jgi:hypothetical protein
MRKPNKGASNPFIPKAPSLGKEKGKNSSLLSVHQQQEISKFREDKVMFSFHFLDLQHKAFNCGRTNESWFLHLFENLREISKLSRNEFVVQQRNHYDVHPHDFNKTEFHYKESLPAGYFEQLNEDWCIQFRLSSSGGRVHGFMIDNTFYVLWLDPHHNMNPGEGYGGVKLYKAPPTPYEILEAEYEGLKKYANELEKMLEELTAPGA